MRAVVFGMAIMAAVGMRPRGESLEQRVVAAERASLDALTRGDSAVFASSIAPEAVFVDARGSAGKDTVVAHSVGSRMPAFTMTNVKFVSVSKTTGVVVYTLTIGTSPPMYASALWAERDGRLICLFSQETRAKSAKSS